MGVLICLVITIYFHSTFCEVLDVEQGNVQSLLKDIVKRLDDKDAIINELKLTVSEQQATEIMQEQRISALEGELWNQVLGQDNKGGSKMTTDDDTNFAQNETTGKNHQLTKPGQHIHKRRADNVMSVAFLATLTAHSLHTGVDQNIKFDNVITNIGNAYHSALGAFVAPVPGIYVFSTTILSYVDSENSFEIQQNGNHVMPIYHKAAALSYDTASVSVTLSLAQGDDVSVASMITDKKCTWTWLYFVYWLSS